MRRRSTGVTGRMAGVIALLIVAACDTTGSDRPGDAGTCEGSPPLVYADAAGVNAGSCCRPVVAYDLGRQCSARIVPDLCFRETRPGDTSGTGSLVTVVDPTGHCFDTFKGYTERLQGSGWASDDNGKGGGYTVWGGGGSYETDVTVLPDGGHTRLSCKPAPDPAPDAGDAATCR